MKRCSRHSLPIALALALAVGTQALAQTPARPPAGAKGGAAKARRDPFAVLIRQAEEIHGKPLTATQKKAVIAAAKERAKARKAAQDRFRASIAKTLGVPLQQWATKEKAYFRAQAQKRGGRPTAARPQ